MNKKIVSNDLQTGRREDVHSHNTGNCSEMNRSTPEENGFYLTEIPSIIVFQRTSEMRKASKHSKHYEEQDC